MNRPRRREVEDPNRKRSEWEENMHLIALGPMKRKDGRWQGCRHYIAEPYAVVGPEPHDHIKETA